MCRRASLGHVTGTPGSQKAPNVMRYPFASPEIEDIDDPNLPTGPPRQQNILVDTVRVSHNEAQKGDALSVTFLNSKEIGGAIPFEPLQHRISDTVPGFAIQAKDLSLLIKGKIQAD